MTDRYERIRDALEMGPTPGPWTAKSHAAPRADNGDIGIINGKGMLVAVAYSNRCTRDNASLIAACDPDTIRELLAERDQLAAENARLRARASGWHEGEDPATEGLNAEDHAVAEIERLREALNTEKYEAAEPKPEQPKQEKSSVF